MRDVKVENIRKSDSFLVISTAVRLRERNKEREREREVLN